MTKTFLIMAGGTGGHVYPALAAADELVAQGGKVVWLGSVGGMEARIVGNTDIPMHLILVKGLRGQGLLTKVMAPSKLLRALWQTFFVFRRVRPDCVLGMGGFAAGPGGLMAVMLNKPLVIHEQNAIPGMTNRWLCKWAKFVLQAFPQTFAKGLTDPDRVHTVGNPVRRDLVSFASPESRGVGTRKPSLLILGGSRGAQALNEIVPKALALMPENLRPEVVHQAGEGKDQKCRELYQELNVAVQVVAFVTDMARQYQRADLVICRAGALTLAELAMVGLGAVLVPYPYAVDDHQTANASYMVEAQAARLLPQQNLSADSLMRTLSELMSCPQKLLEMAKRAAQLAKPGATASVVSYCLQASQ